MGVQVSYSVFTKGSIVKGFSEDKVLESFSRLFDVPEQKAGSYLNASKLVKKNLTFNEAETYRKNLENIGIAIDVFEVQPNEPAPTLAGTSSVNSPSSMTTELNLLLPEEIGGERLDTGTDFSCPKCALTQQRGPQCPNCGVFFIKLKSSRSIQESTEPSARSKHQSTAASCLRHERTGIHGDDQRILLIPIVLAALIALIGALTWNWLAKSTGHEHAIVAWAIGGTIGATAALSGGRGDMTAGFCAVLALLAILGGQYMLSNGSSQQPHQLMNQGDLVTHAQMTHDDAENERQVFARTGRDDDSIKLFMREHNYSDASKAELVTESELTEFREYVQPWLEQTSDSEIAIAYSSDVAPKLGAALADIDPISMIIDSLGLMDLVFLFLGISTAYAIGKNGIA